MKSGRETTVILTQNDANHRRYSIRATHEMISVDYSENENKYRALSKDQNREATGSIFKKI
jgi:hypothetical protein